MTTYRVNDVRGRNGEAELNAIVSGQNSAELPPIQIETVIGFGAFMVIVASWTFTIMRSPTRQSALALGVFILICIVIDGAVRKGRSSR